VAVRWQRYTHNTICVNTICENTICNNTICDHKYKLRHNTYFDPKLSNHASIIQSKAPLIQYKPSTGNTYTICDNTICENTICENLICNNVICDHKYKLNNLNNRSEMVHLITVVGWPTSKPLGTRVPRRTPFYLCYWHMLTRGYQPGC
jgi:hypothetical protein